MCGSDVFLALIAIIFPPLAVWVKRGICSADSFINILLCCLAFLPGLIHAWYIISIYPEPTYEQLAQHDAERGTVTYYYVQTGQPRYAPPPQTRPGQPGYGTVNNVPNAQFPQPQSKPQPQAGPAVPHPSQAAPSNDVPPPTYQQATGDNKIQTP